MSKRVTPDDFRAALEKIEGKTVAMCRQLNLSRALVQYWMGCRYVEPERLKNLAYFTAKTLGWDNPSGVAVQEYPKWKNNVKRTEKVKVAKVSKTSAKEKDDGLTVTLPAHPGPRPTGKTLMRRLIIDFLNTSEVKKQLGY